MKRKIIISICLLLTLFVGHAVAQRVRKHGGLVDILRSGSVVITSKSGQPITLTGTTAHVGASTFSSTLGVSGKATFTADPASTAFANASLVINPATSAVNELLLAAGDNGTVKFSVDKEGDTVIAGGLSLGGTAITATAAEINAGRGAGVKVYRALLSQASTAAPVATVQENSLGGTLVWARTGVGTYTATLAGAFPAGKPNVLLTNGGTDGSFVLWTRTSDNVLTISSINVGGDFADDALIAASIQIIVYP